MTTIQYPEGYKPVYAGTYNGLQIEEFGASETRVTNKEWGEVVFKLGADRFILLKQDKKTHDVTIVGRGSSAQEAAGSNVSLEGDDTKYDMGAEMQQGVFILLKMVDNPSQKYDEPAKDGNPERKFSGANQPVVGVNWYLAKTWTLLKTEQSEGKWKYDLFKDAEYEWMVTDGGKRSLDTYPTPNEKLYAHSFLWWEWGNKQCHIDEYDEGRGTTVDVNDKRNSAGPFGVRTCGDAWTWTDYNQLEVYHYGMRGGSWASYPAFGRASTRDDAYAAYSSYDVGFSAVVRQGSKK